MEIKETKKYQISKNSLNLVNGSISAYEQLLENVKKLPKKAVYVNIKKSHLIFEIESTLLMLKRIKKEAEE